MSRLTHIHAREVLDSRGEPTIEVEARCADGAQGRATVPSGASTGEYEAHELRDGDERRYDGRGVLKAIANIHEVIAPALVGCDAADQRSIDARLLELDASEQKTLLGGNALLGVSLAAAHAAAASRRIPLFRHIHELVRAIGSAGWAEPRMPLPMINMISGGLHAGGNLDFQDFLIQPVGAPDYATGLEWTVRVYRRLGALLSRSGYEGRLVGDEGGYGPRLADHRQACEFLVQAIEAAGLRPGEDVNLAIDVAASHFFDGQGYRLAVDGDKLLSTDALINMLERLCAEFPIASIEDGLQQNDWPGWSELTRRLGGRVHIVGDDLLVTNAARVRRGIDSGACNSLLVKMNQIGTLSETIDAIVTARAGGLRLVVSARSGETADDTIADLAVGVAAEQIKIGSIVRGERLAKYNRLLRIAEQLGG